MKRSLVGLLLLLASCGSERFIGGESQRVIYGSDDRTDYYAVTDPNWKARAFGSVAALIDSNALDESDPQDIRVNFETLAQYSNLCSDQRFLDQPAAASCSATLIDDDLVLTAGHCVETSQDCTGGRFVFRYLMTSESQLGTITSADVFRCGQVLIRTVDDNGTDHAVVRLDRPATPRHVPAPVAKTLTPLQTGEALVAITFPDGIPMKIDSGGHVFSSGGPAYEVFTAALDVFSGSSGGGIFNAAGLLVGIEVRGERDYRRNDTCRIVNVLAENGSQGFEDVCYAANAIIALCQSGYQSARLCGTAADGGTETQADAGVTPPPDGGGATGGDGGGAPPEGGTLSPDADASPVPAAPSPRGGCSAGGSPPGTPWLLLCLLLVVAFRRRASSWK